MKTYTGEISYIKLNPDTVYSILALRCKKNNYFFQVHQQLCATLSIKKQITIKATLAGKQLRRRGFTGTIKEVLVLGEQLTLC